MRSELEAASKLNSSLEELLEDANEKLSYTTKKMDRVELENKKLTNKFKKVQKENKAF